MLDELTKRMQALLKRMSKIKDISKEKIKVEFVTNFDEKFFHLSGNITFQINKEPVIKFYKKAKKIPRENGQFLALRK